MCNNKLEFTAAVARYRKLSAEKKKAEAGSKNRSSEIVDSLLSKGKKNGGTLTYGELVEALQTQHLIALTRQQDDRGVVRFWI